MEQSATTKLIGKGVPDKGIQHWADLGCGNGTFTITLSALLPPNSLIYAVDKERQILPAMIKEVSVVFDRADFVRDNSPLAGLDGILMATHCIM